MKCQIRGCKGEARRFVYRRKAAAAKYLCEKHGDAMVEIIRQEELPSRMGVCLDCGCEFGVMSNGAKPH